MYMLQLLSIFMLPTMYRICECNSYQLVVTPYFARYIWFYSYIVAISAHVIKDYRRNHSFWLCIQVGVTNHH